MFQFFVQLLVNAAGFLTAIALLPGIHPTSSNRVDILVISLVAALINTVFLPIFRFFTLPMTFLTLGLWLWILNMIMFWFAGYVGREVGFGFTVDGFLTTFLGALLVSIVSSVFGFLLLSGQQ